MKLWNRFAAKRAENTAISGGRSKRPQNRPNTPQVLSDVHNSATQGKKLQTGAAVCGRSMVEMLGVLAIIGVLSVGAIAGYQKAMFKYKLNKTVDEIITVISNIQTTFYGKTENLNVYCGWGHCSSGFPKSSIIPDNIKIENNMITLSNNGLLYIGLYTNQRHQFFYLTLYKLSKDACITLSTLDWNNDNIGLISVNAKGETDGDECDINSCFFSGGEETCDNRDGWTTVCAKDAPMPMQTAIKGCTCSDADCEVILGFLL